MSPGSDLVIKIFLSRGMTAHFYKVFFLQYHAQYGRYNFPLSKVFYNKFEEKKDHCTFASIKMK